MAIDKKKYLECEIGKDEKRIDYNKICLGTIRSSLKGGINEK